MNNYLKNIVVPFYQCQAQVDNFVLYDLNKQVVLASQNVLERLKFKNEKQIIGKTFADFKHIKPEFINQLDQIFDLCVQTKQTINFVAIGGQLNSKHKNYHELIFQSYIPIFDSKQQMVAVLARKNPIAKSNLFDLLFPKVRTRLNSNSLVWDILTIREFQITYLLGSGMSQYQIATLLNITRSTVVKTINDRILPKFGINRNSTAELVQEVVAAKIHGKLPKGLVKEQILILD